MKFYWDTGNQIRVDEVLNVKDKDDITMLKVATSKSYNLKDMQRLLDVVPMGQFSLLQASEVARIWGPRIDKVNLSQGSQLSFHINHMRGLIASAIDLHEVGYKVHLIESTSPDNIRIYKDLDLLVSKGETLYFIDYTNHYFGPVNYEGLCVYSDETACKYDKICAGKLSTLKNKSQVKHTSFVLRNPNIKLGEHLLDVPSDQSGPYGDTFDKALQYVRLAQDFTGKQIDALVDISVERLSEEEPGDDYVKFNDKLEPIYDIGKAAVSLEHNSPSAMLYYREVINYLRTTEQNVQNEYSLWFHDKMMEGEMKPFTFVPVISKRSHNTSGLTMHARARQLRDELISKGKKVPIMTLLLSLCNDYDVHPTPSEHAIWTPHVSDPRWGHCHMNICKSKEMRGSFVEVSVDSAYGSGNNFAYGRGTTTGSVSVRSDRDRLQSNSITEDQMESSLQHLTTALSQVPPGNEHVDLLKKIIDDSLHPTPLGSTMRTIARRTVDDRNTSGPLSWSSIYQMVSATLTSMREKYKNYEPKVKTGMSHGRFLMYVGEIGDRNALIFSSPSYTVNSIHNCTCVIEGDLLTVDTAGLFIGKHHESTTRWFDISHSNLDWGVLAFTKTMSYYSMLNDVTLAVTGNTETKVPAEDYTLGAPLMMMNNTRFNQVSGQVRHIFNNTCGYSNGTEKLYEKMSWYEPNNFFERLYCLRMHKMSTLMQMVKSNRDLGHLIQTSKSETKTEDKGYIGLERTSWKVAMPNTARYLPSDQYLYSSFYTSYAFATDRYNLEFSQAQVFNKQVESRREFVMYRNNPRSTDLENLPWIYTTEALFELMKEKLFTDQQGGSHQPCHLTVILGALTSLKNLHKLDSDKQLHTILDHYNNSNRLNTITLQSASNNRASVSERGVGGVLPVRKVSKVIPLKNNRKNVVSTVETQTIKNYEALMIKHHDFIKDVEPIRHVSETFPVSESEYLIKPSLTENIIKELQKGPNKLWPTVYYNMWHRACVVARMIHKDDVKPREIAVMNIFLRLIALSLEETSRYIQSREHDLEDYTNLIENKDKDAIAAKTHRTYQRKKIEGKKVTNDNEDKSAWGPAQDSVSMCITLLMRQQDHTDQYLTVLSFQNYTKKVFKIPDSLALAAKKPRKPFFVPNEVTRAFDTMEEAEFNIYNKTRQYLYACEGMFQGTLSVTSSCCAADCMRLSIEISTRMFKEYKYEATGHVTSDDSVHSKAYTKTKGRSKMYIVRQSLHVHIRVCRNYSYKRNMSCSVHTDYVFELNSIFYTSDGRIVPSIKSRLSYVTYHYEMEFYQSAISIVNKSAEYVRKEGSIMGAYWVALLNTFNHIQQFQLSSLYKELGKKLYHVPLEIGGLPKVDPLMSVSSAPYANFLDNYGSNYALLLAFLTETSPNSEASIPLTKEERDNLRLKQDVPRVTRGSVTNLRIREHKSKRIIRETAMSVSRECYYDLLLEEPTANKAIINCFSREGVYYSESSTALRFSMSQTPYTAKIYHVRSLLLNPYNVKRHSREDLFNIARSITLVNGVLSIMNNRIHPNTVYKNQIVEMSKKHETYIRQMTDYRLDVIQTISQSSYVSTVPELTMTFTEITDLTKEFSYDHRPKVLGGQTDTHPIVYYEAVKGFESRLRSAFCRKQKMNFSITQQEVNESIAHKLLASNFIEGSRIIPADTTAAVPDKITVLADSFDEYLSNYITYDFVDGTMTLENSIKEQKAPKRLDISSLVQYRKPEFSMLWGGPIAGSSCFAKLRKKGLKGLKNENIPKNHGEMSFFIITRMCNPDEQVIYSHGDIKIEQHPAISDNMKKMSKIIIKDGPTYQHYNSVWAGTFNIETDTRMDQYHYRDHSDNNEIRVKLSVISGINVLTVGDDYPIYCIDKHKYTLTQQLLLSQSTRDLLTPNVVRELFYKERAPNEFLTLTALVADITIHTLDDIVTDTPIPIAEARIEAAREEYHRNETALMEVEEEAMIEGDQDDVNDMARLNAFLDMVPEAIDYPLDSSSESEKSVASDEMSEDTYGREEFDVFREPLEEMDTTSQLSSAYSCENNPIPFLARQEGLIFSDGLRHASVDVSRQARRFARKNGRVIKTNIFTLLIPDDIELKAKQKDKLQQDDDVILHLLQVMADYYTANNDSVTYQWFRAYVTECLRRMPGSEPIISRILEDIIAEEMMGEEDDSDSDSNPMNFV